MSDPTQDKIERFAAIKREIRKLEDELDTIEKDVLAFVIESGGKHKTDAYTIKTQKRAKYKYSEACDKMNADLKALKKKEVKDGVATISGYSEFMTIKIKEE